MPTLENEFNKANNDGVIPDIVRFTTAIQSGNFPEQETIITLYKKLLERITANFESDERTSLDDNSIEELKNSDPVLELKSKDWVIRTLNKNIFGSSEKENTFPVLGYFVKDFDSGEPKNISTVDIALWNLDEKNVTVSNISKVKPKTRHNDKLRWPNGRRSLSSKQAGVSILGAQSEYLIQQIMIDLVDDANLMKTPQAQISSYGDFVLMCLPNNLWFSVKSGFARERLLASGFSNDLIGVGFFEDPGEITSTTKARHLKKAGFLAVYLPDFPVSDDQIDDNTNTYDEVIRAFGEDQIKNINGTDFFRKLSNIENHIRALTDKDLRNRFATEF